MKFLSELGKVFIFLSIFLVAKWSGATQGESLIVMVLIMCTNRICDALHAEDEN